MSKLKLVLFDVDGVLLDSLTQHLKICEDKNKEYGLGLNIPSAQEFKGMVRGGRKISPMKYFFLAVGFPEDFARKATLQYEEIFMRQYAPTQFPGIAQTLKALHFAGLKLGIVTSNIRANVQIALGENLGLFDRDCTFFYDDMDGVPKSEAISRAVDATHIPHGQAIYVGDQPTDWEAAKTANVLFLGVSYGWAISQTENRFPIVSDVAGISQYILSQIFNQGAA